MSGEEGGRAKRQAAQVGRGGVKVRSALAELAELRKSGGKRADRFEVKEEEAVYDVVDEKEYARIVQQRREEGGEQRGVRGGLAGRGGRREAGGQGRPSRRGGG